MATTDESKESPLRSLRSFKTEIPGGDGLITMDDKNSSKSLHQYLDMVMNGAIFLFIIVLLVLVVCALVTAELMISLKVILYNDEDKRKNVLRALSATSLAILAFFVVEVVGRLISISTFIKTQKFEIFDIIVVAVTFIIDLALLASEVEVDTPELRAITFLIALRLWRVCGIYYTGISKAKEGAASELHMEKYARNQAEIQADALQAQCDQQLKEIAHLRDCMRQNGLDPESPKIRYPLDYRPGYNISLDFDKTETVRVNDRVNSESSLASAIATFEASTEHERRHDSREGEDRRGRYLLNNHTSSSLPSSSSNPAQQTVISASISASTRTAEAGHSSQAYEIEVGEEAREQGGGDGRGGGEDAPHPPVSEGGMEGISNPAFEDDQSGVVDMEEHSGEASEEHSSPSSNNNADDEAQLRLELEEIKRLSDEAMMEELGNASTTKNINGVPTTSL